MALLIFYLALALFVSFLCSILEAVILSISPSYIQSLEDSNKKSGKYLRKLKEDIDRPLSAILSINTVAHTLGATGVGAQAVKLFGEVYFGIISATLTLLILIFSEIIPKTLGAIYWKILAPPSAKILRVMIVIAYPLVILSDFITGIIAKNKKVTYTSREEVAALARIGYQEGIFDANESRIIANLTYLKRINVKKILTPRTVLAGAPEEMTLQEFFRHEELLRFSRIPLYKDKIDNITGFLLKHDLLKNLANDNHQVTLGELKRPIEVVYEKISVLKVFDILIQKKENIALVVDEYGGVTGVVTMEDILESLLGMEIVDELDYDQDMQKLALEKWKARAKKLGI